MNFMDLTDKLLDIAKEQKCKITLDYEDGVQLIVHGSDVIQARDEAFAEERRKKYVNEKKDNVVHVVVSSPTP